MTDNKVRRKFSPYTHALVAIFLGCLSLTPLWYESLRTDRVTLTEWICVCVWALFIGAAFWFARCACSSERLDYYDGLLMTAACMTTGWMPITLFFVFPVLLVVFVVSIIVTLAGLVRRDASYAPHRFYRIVVFFYQHRMRQ